MRRRQILPAQEVRHIADVMKAKAVPQPEFVAVRELRPPADDEPCALCGLKKIGRPKR